MIQLIGNIYGVEVQKNAECFFLDRKHGLRFETLSSMQWVALPPGSYEAIGLGSEVRGETAAGIVERYCEMYRDYESKLGGLAAHCLSATASLHSLIRSKGMEPETIFLIRNLLI